MIRSSFPSDLLPFLMIASDYRDHLTPTYTSGNGDQFITTHAVMDLFCNSERMRQIAKEKEHRAFERRARENRGYDDGEDVPMSSGGWSRWKNS